MRASPGVITLVTGIEGSDPMTSKNEGPRGDWRGIQELDVSGRRVLARMDFNVPLSDGEVADDNRIRAGIPTLKKLLEADAAVVIASHLGRPGGQPDPALSLRPVAQRLEKLLERPVAFVPESVGGEVENAVARLDPGTLLLLENTRFHPGEEDNDDEYAAALARLADLFVSDAFASLHRAHASIVGVAAKLPAAAGLLVQKELEALGRVVDDPARPYMVVIGGAKVSDKLSAIERFLGHADAILVGGAVANTFLAAQGRELGESVFDSEHLDRASALLKKRWASIVLPMDVVVTDHGEDAAAARVTAVSDIAARCRVMDIGPETIARFQRELATAATIVWAGPPGRFEIEPFSKGTFAIAEALSRSEAFVAAGGGDTVAALRAEGVVAGIDHVSTGGGAMLSFVSGGPMPGLEALRRDSKGRR